MTPKQAGMKRSAAQTAEPSTSKTKKTRFVDPSEDPINFAEQVDSALENPSRKGKIKNEGYESDSSDDGEGVVRSRKKAGNKDAADDEDDDMFAMAEKEDNENAETGSKKKKEQYMRLGDIEGQEFGAGSSGEDDEDDEPEDEDDAERRAKSGMGFELSSFNMREEMEEGKFTEDGTYVRAFDPHGQHDRWMEGLDEREIKLARRRKREQERRQRERVEAEERELKESGGKSTMEKELLGMLKKGETVLEALQRFGSLAKKNQGKGKSDAESKTAVGNGMAIDKSHNTISDIEKVTHLASSLMSLGDTDIYSKTYEELVRSVRSSGVVDQTWEPPSADVKYEYKWDMPGTADSAEGTFGPFSEDEMAAWFKALYFGPSGEKVKVRQVGGEWGDWDDVLQ